MFAYIVHTSLQASPVPSLGSNYQEAIWADIELDKGDILLVGCKYRSPRSLDVNNHNLIDMVKASINCRHTHLLVMGNFNCPNIVWINLHVLSSANSAEHDFIGCIRDEGLFQHVTFPTRARVGHNANILDLVMTN